MKDLDLVDLKRVRAGQEGLGLGRAVRIPGMRVRTAQVRVAAVGQVRIVRNLQIAPAEHGPERRITKDRLSTLELPQLDRLVVSVDQAEQERVRIVPVPARVHPRNRGVPAEHATVQRANQNQGPADSVAFVVKVRHLKSVPCAPIDQFELAVESKLAELH